MSDIPRYLALDSSRRSLGLTVEDCWADAFALGSHIDSLMLSEFFEGSRSLPVGEVEILSAALEDRRLIREPAAVDLLNAVVARMFSSPAPPLLQPGTNPAAAGGSPQSDDGDRWLTRLGEHRVYLRSDEWTSIRAAAEPSVPGDVNEPSLGSTLRIDAAANDAWEMHTRGDELVILLSGAAEVAIDRSDTQLTLLTQPYQACVLPRGRWHRHYAKTDNTKLLYVTPVRDIASEPA